MSILLPGDLRGVHGLGWLVRRPPVHEQRDDRGSTGCVPFESRNPDITDAPTDVERIDYDIVQPDIAVSLSGKKGTFHERVRLVA